MRRVGAICGALLALCATPALAGDRGSFVARSAAGAEEPALTRAQIERARPLAPVARADRLGAPLARAAVPFASGEVPDPTVFPNSASGKLVGKLRGFGTFECSATVLDSATGRVILTAGHCVYDPGLGRFARRLTFVPAYTGGAAPFGVWRWAALETTAEWVRHANTNFDFATIVLRRSPAGSKVEEVTGGAALRANGPRGVEYRAVGYPGNRAGGQRMWSCESGYAGPDPRPFRRGRAPVGIGCDMGAGASGGGWFDAAGRLVSLTSFAYSARPETLYGPYLGRKAARLVARTGAGRARADRSEGDRGVGTL